MDAQGLADQVGDHCLVGAPELLARKHSVELTVRPVQSVLKDCQRVGMQQVLKVKNTPG